MKMIKLRVKNSFSCSLEIYFKLQMSNLPSQFFLIIKFQNATLMEKKCYLGQKQVCVFHTKIIVWLWLIQMVSLYCYFFLLIITHLSYSTTSQFLKQIQRKKQHVVSNGKKRAKNVLRECDMKKSYLSNTCLVVFFMCKQKLPLVSFHIHFYWFLLNEVNLLI